MINKETEEFGTVCIIGEKTENVPMWTINHYFKVLCDNYAKLVMLTRLCGLMQEGISSSEIVISMDSAPLVSDKQALSKYLYDNKKYMVYPLEENTEKFWHYFMKCERPMMYRKEPGGELIPLYNYFEKEAVKITSVSYHSPITIETQGIVNEMVDLVTARSRYEMECQEHAARQIGNLAQGYEKIARASQIISDPRTPEGIRIYAEDGLRRLMIRQGKLNEQLGIRMEKTDRRL